MAIARPSHIAHPLTCPACGERVVAPPRSEALLDENGNAHVPCVCGRVIVVPYEAVEPEASGPRRRPSWQLAALWIVIIGLMLLLMPVIRDDPQPEPTPPFYLTT